MKKTAETMLKVAFAIMSTATNAEITPMFVASFDLNGSEDKRYPVLPILKSLPSIPKR